MKNYSDETGPILKGGFVQNAVHCPMKTVKNRSDLVRVLTSFHNNASGSFSKPNIIPAEVFPYLILQPRMIKNDESKVILKGGVPLFILQQNKKCISSKVKTEKEIFDFAENACRALGVATDGLVAGGLLLVGVIIGTPNILAVDCGIGAIGCPFLGTGAIPATLGALGLLIA